MLPGFVPFPPEFAARYRQKGYWQDQSLAREFEAVYQRFASRTVLVDGERAFTYAELDQASTNLALNLLKIGIKPLDRVGPGLPNVHEFVSLYFALQKIGAIPIAALVSHRFAEINQFVNLSGASTCVYPKTTGDFSFLPVMDRIQADNPNFKIRIVLGDAGPGEHSLRALIDRPAALPRSRLKDIQIDPSDPCIFQLSGGTTGVPKLIPRTHNDYAYNSKVAASVCEVNADSVLLLVLPIAHNLPLACPGIQGFMFHGAKVVLHANTRPAEMFALIQKHKVTHLKVVPALLIRLINDPTAKDYDLSSLKLIQSGGQRMQPEVRAKTRALIPGVFVQENFGMSEGTLMFVRATDTEEVKLETCGRPVCADDEVKLLDEEDREVPIGEVGELTVRGPYTLRGYFGVPEYNAKQFTTDGFYRSGDLMRMHPSGNFVVEGRKKDLINRGGEKISAEEVENLILMHPAVQNVTCVPMPDANMGEIAIRQATKAGKELGFIGFHFHPIMQHFAVNDRRHYDLFEVINSLGAAVMIDVGTTGMGAGMPGGNGARVRHAHPSHIDDLAADFPKLKIIMAHPGWPWVEETTAVALHKGNVFWEMSGWAPKHFPGNLKVDIRGRLQDKIMFGSDYPSLPYERILREWSELGYKDEVMEKIMHGNAERVLGL